MKALIVLVVSLVAGVGGLVGAAWMFGAPVLAFAAKLGLSKGALVRMMRRAAMRRAGRAAIQRGRDELSRRRAPDAER